MPGLKITANPQVELVFNSYPDRVRKPLYRLRNMILETATELEDITHLEETLKWGEPSYLVKKGSTIRMAWKAKKPDQFALYFKCTSLLVPTFKQVFGEVFQYEGNRAIVFQIGDELPSELLKKCITAALRYHRVKLLPDLDITSPSNRN